MEKKVSKDWDFIDNTREYFTRKKSTSVEKTDTVKFSTISTIWDKLKKFNVFRVAWAFFLWIPLELFPCIIAPFFYLWLFFLRRKIPKEKMAFIEKAMDCALNNFEIVAFVSPIDVLFFREFKDFIRERPSIQVGAAASPRMKFMGPTFFSTPLMYDEPFDVGSDILLSEMALLKDNPAFRHVMIYSFQEMPFRDESIGCVSAPHIIDHVPSRLETIKETARVLRPGGIFIFTDASEYFSSHHPIVWIARKLFIDRLFPDFLKKTRMTTLFMGLPETMEWYQKTLDREGFDLEVAKYMVSTKLHVYMQFVATFYRINKGVLVWHSVVMTLPIINRILRFAWKTVQLALILHDIVNPPKIGAELAFLARKRGNIKDSESIETNPLKLIVCPKTHEPLIYNESTREYATASGMRYPVIDGIPVLNREIADMYYETTSIEPQPHSKIVQK